MKSNRLALRRCSICSYVAPCNRQFAREVATGITDTSVTIWRRKRNTAQRPAPYSLPFQQTTACRGMRQISEKLITRKDVFFVPFYQDNPATKPSSGIADFDLLPEAARLALEGTQMQPLLRCLPAGS